MVSSVDTVRVARRHPNLFMRAWLPVHPCCEICWCGWCGCFPSEAGEAESLFPSCKGFSEYKGLPRGDMLPPPLSAPPHRRRVFPLVRPDLTSVQAEQVVCVPCDCGVSQELSLLPLLSTRRDDQSQVWWLWA